MWKVKAMPDTSTSPARQSRARSYRSYSPSALTEAFCWVKNKNGSVYRAARKFGVPEGTLRDRVNGRVDPEVTRSGPTPVFSLLEENNLVKYLKKMALLGFGYSRADILDIATAYAVSANKRETDHHLGLKWFRHFMLRWPELNVKKPRSLDLYRVKATSAMAVNAYYTELDQMLTKYKLKDAPERIFCVDEKGLTQYHSPRDIITSSSSSTALDGTRDKEMTVTLIGAGNALGQQLPPYFIFSGKEMRQELLNGCSPGAEGTVSDNGWSSADSFKTYLSTHFLKYVTSNRSGDEPILLLCDGYLSQTNLSLIDWAQEQNILLFVLPAHTSHILQPLDLECFGSFESVYNSLCHQQMQANSTTDIDRFSICEIACNAYTEALSTDSLRSSFKKWGIYPLNSAVVNGTRYAPALKAINKCVPARGDGLAVKVEVGEGDLAEEVEVDPHGDHSYADLPESRPGLLKERKYSIRNRKKKMCTCSERQSRKRSYKSRSSKASVGSAERKAGIPKSTQQDHVKSTVDPEVTRSGPASVCTIYEPGVDVNKCVLPREDYLAEEVDFDPQGEQSSAGLPDLKPDLLKEREDSLSKSKKNTCTSPVRQSRKSSYRIYSPTSLTKAVCWVKNKNGSVYRAARKFGVPEGTLRDRVNGRVDPEVTKSGPPPLFNFEEESKLVNYLKKMALLGFGYSRAELLDIATAYAVSANKREPDRHLGLKWFRHFMLRWPELNVKKPRSLDLYRVKATSEMVVNAYYTELDQMLTKYKLKDAPERIFSIDEKGLKQYHSPPIIVDSSSTSASLAVTSDKEMIVTIVGAGNALGQQLPPYFIFPGQQMRQELLNGCSPSAAGTVSESGRSNTGIFKTYLSTHFLKYVTTHRSEDEPLLILYDGYLSQINLSLIDWAREQNILLFVLPSHTSRILRPLDLGCFGPFESIYNSLCHRQMRANSTKGIDRHSICEIACNAYTNALSTDILRSSFKKWGIYPLNSAVVDDTMYAPVLKAATKSVPAREDDLSEEVNFDPQGDQSSAGLPDLRPDLFKDTEHSVGQGKQNMCISPVLQSRASSYRSYSPTALSEAFCLVMNKNGSVYGAARRFGVPEATLWDRIMGRVGPEVSRSGPLPVFSLEEENKLVNHLNKMALLGFGYSTVEVTDIATAYAVIVNKRKKDHPLSLKWFRTFVKRWPELSVKKPRSLGRRRAKATSELAVNAYYVELDQIMTKYKLKDAPERIFCVDEKGLTQNHSPPVIGSSSSSTVLDSTRDKEMTVTIIGAGNALGQQLPPYFVFQGQRMRQELLNGCSYSAAGTVSDSGHSNACIFKKYLSTHFLKCLPACQSGDEPVLLLYDGYLSRTNLSLIDWARDRNILLFVLPAHTSHILQPLDLGWFEPFESVYNSLCHQQMQANSTTGIDRYSICEIACNAYIEALSTDILRSLFKKWGIYPLNSAVVNGTRYAPALKAVNKCVPTCKREDDFAVEVEVRENDFAEEVENGENCFAVEVEFGENDFAEEVEVGENGYAEQVEARANDLAEPVAFVPQGNQSSAGLPDSRPDLSKERRNSMGPPKKKTSTSPEIQSRKRSYRSYSSKALTKAVCWVKDKNGSVYRAARKFGVPEGTLRDRVNGKIDPEVTRSGPPPLFSLDEESNLVNHLKKMAVLGFGYSRAEVINLATTYAVSVNKRDEGQPLTFPWFRHFMSRWPELNVENSKGLRKDEREYDLAEEMKVDQQGDHLSDSLPDSRPDLFKEIEDSIGQRKMAAKKRRAPSFIVSGNTSTENVTRKKTAKYNAGKQTSTSEEKHLKKRKKLTKKRNK